MGKMQSTLRYADDKCCFSVPADWIQLAQNCVQWLALVNKVTYILIEQNMEFLE
jgi:hypothetical protein